MENKQQKFWYEEEKQIEKKNFEGLSLLDFIQQFLKTGKKPELSQLNDIDNSTLDLNNVENKELQILMTSNWLNLLPFVLSIIAQILLVQKVWFGGILYFVVFLIFTYLFFRNKFQINQIPNANPQKDNLYFRLLPFIVGIILMVLAFFSFNNNLFTVKNITLWVLTLILMLLSFWVYQENLFKIKVKFSKWKKENYPIRFSGWNFLLVSSFILIFFFKFYHLDIVLPEMISDHAEKLLDVFDILNGKFSIFFTRNTGREPLQFYLIALTTKVFKTGVSYLSMKIGTALFGFIMCFYMYLLGKEIGNKWIGLFSAMLLGVSFWGNVLSRVALRFILYPAFVAPTLYYFIRGIRKGSRNDFILAGITLGIGLSGYSPIRVLPIVICTGIILYLIHRSSKNYRYQAFVGFVLIVLFSLVLFLPLGRYFVENPQSFLYRQSTRMTSIENPINGSPVNVFVQNVFDGFLMFNWNDGEIWVNSIPGRPLLDVFSASFFTIGLIIVFFRYLKYRNWIDIFLLISFFILMLPSTLSIAYPAENPAPNRAGGAMVVVFYFTAFGLYTLLKQVSSMIKHRQKFSVTILAITILGLITVLNYNLMFVQHNNIYKNNAWNTSEMGEVLKEYLSQGVKAGDVHVIAYPYWVDGRLVAFNAGLAGLDLSYSIENIASLVFNQNQQVFLLKPDHAYAIELLKELFPNGELKIFESFTPSKDFYIFTTN